jgi:hypothetical protein
MDRMSAGALSLALSPLGTGAVSLVMNQPTNEPCRRAGLGSLGGSSSSSELCTNVFGGLAEWPSAAEATIMALLIGLVAFGGLWLWEEHSGQAA